MGGGGRVVGTIVWCAQRGVVEYGRLEESDGEVLTLIDIYIYRYSCEVCIVTCRLMYFLSRVFCIVSTVCRRQICSYMN